MSMQVRESSLAGTMIEGLEMVGWSFFPKAVLEVERGRTKDKVRRAVTMSFKEMEDILFIGYVFPWN